MLEIFAFKKRNCKQIIYCASNYDIIFRKSVSFRYDTYKMHIWCERLKEVPKNVQHTNSHQTFIGVNGILLSIRKAAANTAVAVLMGRHWNDWPFWHFFSVIISCDLCGHLFLFLSYGSNMLDTSLIEMDIFIAALFFLSELKVGKEYLAISFVLIEDTV